MNLRKRINNVIFFLIVSNLLFLIVIKCQDIEDGLIGHWKFEETNIIFNVNDEVKNSSSNFNHGSLHGNVISTTEGFSGKAFRFNCNENNGYDKLQRNKNMP